MRNARLEEARAGIKIARRNINNLRYADDTTLMSESEEELKSFLMKVKEENEKVGLKFNIQHLLPSVIFIFMYSFTYLSLSTKQTVKCKIAGTCAINGYILST